MKQVLQHLCTGNMELADVPCPIVGRGAVLIQTRASLISAGTERMLVEFGRRPPGRRRATAGEGQAGARQDPTDGLLPTLEAVFRKLDEPLPWATATPASCWRSAAGVT